MVYGRRIFHAPTKGQKSAERNDPLPLGNNFQDPVLPLEASRMGRWIWKKFLNISSVSNPFPRKGMRASGRRTWLSQTFFFRANKSIPYSGYLASEKRGPGRMQISGREKLGELLSPREKYLLSAVCVFDLALFTLPCLIQISPPPSSSSFIVASSLLLFLVRLHLVITPSTPLRRRTITTYYGLL